jgi:hypothetical protein
LEDGELLIVTSDKPCPDATAIYARRWEIETLFSCLKERGFNLEETRVTDLARIKRLAKSYFKYWLYWIRNKLLKPYAALGSALYYNHSYKSLIK